MCIQRYQPYQCRHGHVTKHKPVGFLIRCSARTPCRFDQITKQYEMTQTVNHKTRLSDGSTVQWCPQCRKIDLEKDWKLVVDAVDNAFDTRDTEFDEDVLQALQFDKELGTELFNMKGPINRLVAKASYDQPQPLQLPRILRKNDLPIHFQEDWPRDLPANPESARFLAGLTRSDLSRDPASPYWKPGS